VVSSDKTMPNLVLKNIKNPMRIKEVLHNQVEEMKIRRRMRVGEVMGMPDYNDAGDDADLDEP